jgi:hypothetical protein
MKNFMKKFVLVLLLFPTLVFCQTTDKTARFTLGLSFSPDYCYRSLTSDSSGKFIKDLRDSTEIAKFGYTTGVNFSYIISKRFSVDAAILFSDKGEQMNKGFDVLNPLNPEDPLLAAKLRINYHYYYLDVPIKINFNILTKKVKLYLTAGISPNIYLVYKSKSVLEFDNGHKKKSTSSGRGDYSDINLSVIGGIGFSYDFAKHWSFRLEPVYRRSVISIINTPVKGYLYSIGINTGVYYNFLR